MPKASAGTGNCGAGDFGTAPGARVAEACPAKVSCVGDGAGHCGAGGFGNAPGARVAEACPAKASCVGAGAGNSGAGGFGIAPGARVAAACPAKASCVGAATGSEGAAPEQRAPAVLLPAAPAALLPAGHPEADLPLAAAKPAAVVVAWAAYAVARTGPAREIAARPATPWRTFRFWAAAV